MAWTGDVARVHCDVISAETYVENATDVLEGMEEGAPARKALIPLICASISLGQALRHLERGVSPEVLELLRGQVMPLERP
ncbi:MAG: hypothetical protein KAX80_05515 [Planctomycetes bacterium]|nr:hypothetical protein [Planctomycetota bacterium]